MDIGMSINPSKRGKTLCCVLFSAMALSYTAWAAADDPQAKIESRSLLKTDRAWNGQIYRSYPQADPEISVLKIIIPPHAKLPWHQHPMINAAYVVSGTLYVESQDGKHKKIFHAGDVIAEMVAAAHRGYTKGKRVELIVFYAGVAGMPLAVPVEPATPH
jgi:quercetin dioxygenase-like cupin family protein